MKIDKKFSLLFEVKTVKTFSTVSLSLMAFQLSAFLPMLISSLMLGLTGDAFALSVFGLANTFFSIFFLSIVNAITENLSVDCTREFSQGNFINMASYFYKGLFSLLALFLIFAGLVFCSLSIFIFVGISEDLAFATSEMLKLSIFYIAFTTLNNGFVCFLAAQAITRPMLLVNSVTVVIAFVFSKVFILDLKLKQIGFVYSKIIQEIFATACYLLIIFLKANSETLRILSFRETFKDSKNFFLFLAKTIFSYYGEYLGFEFNTYFAALLHNLSELAIWCAFVNYCGLIFYVSCGFSGAFRLLIGQTSAVGKVSLARKLSQVYFIYLAIFSYLLIVVLVVFKYEIAWAYTGDELMSVRLAKLISLYCFTVFPTMGFCAIFSLYRILGLYDFLLRLSALVYPLIMVVVSFLLCFGAGLGVFGIALSFTLSKAGVFYFLVWKLYWEIDWKRQISKRGENIDEEKQVNLV